MVSSLDTLRNVHDRLRLAKIAEEAGVPVPETRSLDDVDEWDSELIVKSRFNLLTDEYIGSLSSGKSSVIKSVKYLQPGERPGTDALRDEMGHIPIVQEFVPIADEYMFAALYGHGEALATYQHRPIKGSPT